jgi:AraC-like DNA-binding protein
MKLEDPHLREEGELGLAGWIGQSRGMTAAHRHLDLEINYVLDGPMTYLIGGRMVDLPPCRLCLLWGGVPHQMIRSRRCAEVIWVTIPLTTVLRWGMPDELIRPLLANGILADPAPQSGDLNLLHQWLADLPRPGEQAPVEMREGAARRIVLLEIEARLRRLAMALSRQTAEEADHGGAVSGELSLREVSAHSDRGLSAVEAMAQFMSRNFRTDIGVAEIAEEAYLHPNYAMTLFRRHTGMTLSQYLVLQRIAHAQRLLATTGSPIHEIAFSSGFGSVSRFYEAFQKQTGNSPRRFRLQMEQGVGGDQRTSESSVDGEHG